MNGESYRGGLVKALRRIRKFGPHSLFTALGLDPAKNDPTGSWSLTAKDFERNGRMIGETAPATLIVQAGGYHIRSLGGNARSFFQGLAAEMFWAVRQLPCVERHYQDLQKICLSSPGA